MRAAVMHQVGGALQVQDVDLGSVGPGEVRVRTVVSGICHSDLSVLEGALPTVAPVVLGHEPGGIVEEVGEQVRGLAPGDRVIGCPVVGCGVCERCLRGRPNLCQAGVTLRPPEAPPRLSRGGDPVTQFVGLASFGSEMLVDARSLVKVPEDVPLESAALISCGVTTGLGAALNCARIEPGSRVVVLGCGGVGLAALQGARIAGALEITAIDTQPWKLDLARTLGATHTLQAGDDNVAQVRDASGGGVDYCLECSGIADLVVPGLRMLRAGGALVLVGVPPITAVAGLPVAEMVISEKRILSSFVGSSPYGVEVPRALAFYRAGQLKLDELISHRLPLEEVNTAFEHIRKGQATRCVLTY